MSSSSSSNLETRSLLDELRNFDKGTLFDLGHPLLNRITDTFVKAAGIGAVQAISRDAYFIAIESAGIDPSGIPDLQGAKKQRFPDFSGETNSRSLEAMVKNTGRESLQWEKQCSCRCNYWSSIGIHLGGSFARADCSICHYRGSSLYSS
ncbi:outer envelope pore protein 16-2, chloroplastic-like isoform X2 [Telopea speciosissima]|uniref:outer envelope pore protein 16-2, chloroplastic-like isoform X2 n=1 Tax=Telopea speciosissima TaxID=54955 RepID=UPI001CC35D21|nr:outer envelope pore protein 16-2, chloroplastic-like isoform X2 [Telopea speciosissima]